MAWAVYMNVNMARVVKSAISSWILRTMRLYTCFGELCHPQRGGAYPPWTRGRCIKIAPHLGHYGEMGSPRGRNMTIQMKRKQK